MHPALTIRNETQGDHGAIGAVTAAAFATLAISNHTEAFIIEALRAANAPTLSMPSSPPPHGVVYGALMV